MIPKPIEKNEWYLLSEIIGNGWIHTRLGYNATRKYLYTLIKSRKLKARDVLVSHTDAHYYQVLGRDLIRYIVKNLINHKE